MNRRSFGVALTVCAAGCVLVSVLQRPALAATETGAPASSPKTSGGMPQPKRVAAPAVEPVTIGKLRFQVILRGKERGLAQNGGYIAALDAASLKELWVLRVYEIKYDPSLETDVQDVFITSMSKRLFRDVLKITDENGRSYLVDINTRKVTAN